MKKRYFYLLLTAAVSISQTALAERETGHDTIPNHILNEVVVTSPTKETNRLQQLPGAISILSPQTIQLRQIDDIKGLSAFVPNFFMPDYGAKLTSAVYIRGIGARSSGQSIGLYVDNVPYLDKSTFDFELSDISHIEVLRGPQGTLYGRNAMSGIINIYTRSPLDYQGTKILLSAGNYGLFRAKGSHYIKLGDRVGIAASYYYDRHDGFFKKQNGTPIDNEASTGGRVKIDWQITPQLKARYSMNYDYTDQSQAFAYGYYNAASDRVEAPAMTDPSSYRRQMVGNHLYLEYKTDRFLLTSTTGYQYFDDDMKMDQDFSPKNMFVLNQRQKQHAWSEELAIRSNHTGPYQWSFGAFGFYDNLRTDGPVRFKEDGVKEILQQTFDALQTLSPRMPVMRITNNRIDVPGYFKTPTYGWALFHQSTYDDLFVKGLSLTAGIRLDYERAKLDYDSRIDEMKVGFYMQRPNPADPEKPIEIQIAEENINPVLTGTESQDFWQVLPKISLRYQCSPRTFTYLSVSKGYKTGGYNVQMFGDLVQEQGQYDLMKKYEAMLPADQKPSAPLPVRDVASYKPEHSWNYEAGVRSELIPGRLQAELTVFFMDIRNMQLTKFAPNGSGRMLTNAGKARSYGVEAGLTGKIAEGLTADLNYGYTHATFRDYLFQKKERVEGEAFKQLVEYDCDGRYIPYAPRHTLSLGLTYNHLFRNGPFDQFTASAQYTGAGKIYWTELNDLAQPFYGTLQAKAGIRKGIFRVDVWARNLLDTEYKAFYFESFDQPFFQLGRPFQLGADVAIVF